MRKFAAIFFVLLAFVSSLALMSKPALAQVPPAGGACNLLPGACFPPALQFCVKNQSNQPIAGAQVVPHTSSNLVVSTASGATPSDTAGFAASPAYVLTGIDGCTNPTFINYSAVVMLTTYQSLTSATNYLTRTVDWTWLGGTQIVNIQLARAAAIIDQSSLTKTPTRAELVGGQRTTTVTIPFTVTGLAGDELNFVMLYERLPNYFTFATTPNFTYDGNAISASPDGARQRVDIDLGRVGVGNHTLTFDVTISAALADGTYAIDAADGTCGNTVSHFQYLDSLGVDQCSAVPAGSIVRRTPKVVLNADAWIGDKSVTASNRLQIGSNSLIISGQNTTSGGQGVGISNYNLPTTGKLAWTNPNRTGIEDQMQQRVTRAASSGTAIRLATCPSTAPQTAIYLDSKTSPFDGSSRDVGSKKIWYYETPCNLTIDNAEVYGSGTIVNGGQLTLQGKLTFSETNDSFGYAAFGNGVFDTANGKVTVTTNAELHNLAIFTTGTIILDANTGAVSKQHEAQLIGKFIQFPASNLMLNDITFKSPLSTSNNIPPLFQQFSLPIGNEVP